MTKEIGIGIVGGGYMGKAHAVAMTAVGAVFETALRPTLEMVAGSTLDSGKRLAKKSEGEVSSAKSGETATERRLPDTPPA